MVIRFLVDAQLPPRLARSLAAEGYQAEHVEDLGMRHAEDEAIWQPQSSIRPSSLAASLSRVLRSFQLLVIWCVVFLAGVSQSSAFAPEKRVGNFFADEAFSRPVELVQVPQLLLDNPVWEAEFTLGSTVGTMFDPHGLFEIYGHLGRAAGRMGVVINYDGNQHTYDFGRYVGQYKDTPALL